MVVGRDFLLRLLLVAYISDGSLRPHHTMAGLSTSIVAGSASGGLPGPVLRVRKPARDAIRSWRNSFRAVGLGLTGIGQVHGYRTGLECHRLFPVISSIPYSIGEMGRCLRRRVFADYVECTDCLCSAFQRSSSLIRFRDYSFNGPFHSRVEQF